MIELKYNIIGLDFNKNKEFIDLSYKTFYSKNLVTSGYNYYNLAANFNGTDYDLFIIFMIKKETSNAKKIIIDNYGRIKINISSLIKYIKYNNPNIKNKGKINIDLEVYETKDNYKIFKIEF